MHFLHIVGARPNFMKAAPVMRALGSWDGVRQTLVHTGQHYDANMSDVFFHDLEIPEPDINLGVGSGSHAQQTAQILNQLEPVLLEYPPDLALVYGDVYSTVAAALVCSKLLIPVGHVEAGLRSFDRTMPEEINRLVTDQVADLLFTPSADADENLRAEGIPQERIRLVGNVMIDSLHKHLERSRQSSIKTQLGLTDENYAVLTLHRPANVDELAVFGRILDALEKISEQLPVVFPIHPRTRKTIIELGLRERVAAMKGFRLIDPLSYLDFLSLYSGARLVLTDSGGIQEETSVLGIPCLTLRENTERPITVTMGTNIIVGSDPARIIATAFTALNERARRPVNIPLWDGHTAERILAAL